MYTSITFTPKLGYTQYYVLPMCTDTDTPMTTIQAQSYYNGIS